MIEICTQMHIAAQIMWTSAFAIILVGSAINGLAEFGVVAIIGIAAWLLFSAMGLLQHQLLLSKIDHAP